MPDYAIYHDLFIDVPASKVFEAISQPRHLVNWWPLKCSGEAVSAGSYNFYFTEEYDWYGQVSKVIPGLAFYIKMTQADADWINTSFGFDLKTTTNGTQVAFWHTGWPACNTHFRRSSYCWAILLQGLKNYLEKGIVVPFSERQ